MKYKYFLICDSPYRWNRPVPIAKWSPNVLNATSRAPACPQPPCGGIPSILCPTIVISFASQSHRIVEHSSV